MLKKSKIHWTESGIRVNQNRYKKVRIYLVKLKNFWIIAQNVYWQKQILITLSTFQTKVFSFIGEYRHYYNLPKRRDEGRLSTNYSGNYFGLFAEPSFVFVKGQEATNLYSGGVWGIQRNYNSHVHLDLSIQAGIGQNGFETKAGLRLGFWVK